MPQLRNLSAIALLTLAMHGWSLDSDNDQPITIEANSALVDEKKGETIYTGDVVIKQGSMLLQADILTVKQDSKTKEAQQLSAHGSPALFEQLPQADEAKVLAQAKTIIYFIENDKIELIGDAHLKQGDSEISSDKIIYLAKEKIFQAKQHNNQDEKSRVQVTIPAPKKNKEQEQEQDIDTQ